MLSPQVVDDLKAFDWQKIIDLCSSFGDLNGEQWRFLKGLCIELTAEKYSTGLVYVGEKHRDYDWPRHNISVEMKSITSAPLYGKRGKLRKNIGIILNNSMGTNKDKLDPDNVADVLICVCQNGAFVVSKSFILEKSVYYGDGWKINVNRDDMIEITGQLTGTPNTSIQIKQAVMQAIKSVI